MPRHARFMLSKKHLALALTINDSLSHGVTHFPTLKADINPPNLLLRHTNRETLRRHTALRQTIPPPRMGTGVTSHCTLGISMIYMSQFPTFNPGSRCHVQIVHHDRNYLSVCYISEWMINSKFLKCCNVPMRLPWSLNVSMQSRAKAFSSIIRMA